MSTLADESGVASGYLAVRCVDPRLLKELDEMARRHDRSRSAEVRRLLREAVRRERELEAAA